MTREPEGPGFDPDWHQTEDAGEIVHAIGLLSVEWNMTEHYMSLLLTNFLPGGITAATVTMGMGNQSKTAALIKFAEGRRISKIGRESIEFCCKCFDRMRENRNIIVHSHSIRPYRDDKFVFVRSNSKAPHLHVGCELSLGDVYDNISVTMILGYLLTELWVKTSTSKSVKSKNASWPKVFEMPEKLKSQPIENFIFD